MSVEEISRFEASRILDTLSRIEEKVDDVQKFSSTNHTDIALLTNRLDMALASIDSFKRNQSEGEGRLAALEQARDDNSRIQAGLLAAIRKAEKRDRDTRIMVRGTMVAWCMGAIGVAWSFFIAHINMSYKP